MDYYQDLNKKYNFELKNVLKDVVKENFKS